jgi:O-antigen ligase
MSNLFSILVIIIPALGMVAGLASSATIILLLVVSLIYLRDKITVSLTSLKLELFFMAWCLISCCWSINLVSSLLHYVQIFAVVLIGLSIKNNINRFDHLKGKVEKSLLIGLFIAISLFFIEYFSNGIISSSFRKVFQPSSTKLFYLYDLDRGCALFTLLSWIFIGFLFLRAKYLLSLLFYIFVLYMLSISDSLASFLAFLFSGIIVIICKLVSLRFMKIAGFVLIIGSILMPIFAYNIDPLYISNNYDRYIPDSAKHRLFIWHYVAGKTIEKPILGIGFNSSKRIKINDDEIIKYKAYSWSPLPLHPHNNIMQIFLETGLIGLFLFLALVYKFCRQATVASNYDSDYSLISFACFTNYYLIGMISFGIWQSWWVCSAIWASIMLQFLKRSNLK